MSPILKGPYYIGDRDSPTDQVGSFLKWLNQTWTGTERPKVGFLCTEAPAYRTAMPLVELYCNELDIEVVGQEWVPFALMDTSVELTRLTSKEPDWIYMIVISGATAKVVMPDAIRLGVKDEVNWCLIGNNFDESMIDLAPEAVEGIYSQTMTALCTEDVPGIRLAREVIKRYRGVDASLFRVAAWPSAMFMVEGQRIALEQVGYENLSPDALMNGWLSVRDLDTMGLTPPLTVDSDYPVMNPWTKMAVIEGGKIEAISDWDKNPELLKQSLKF